MLMRVMRKNILKLILKYVDGTVADFPKQLHSSLRRMYGWIVEYASLH